MKPARETWIDYARGIAIILVLYRHVFEGIKNAGISVDHYLFIEHFNMMFFSFRMPLFFIVSGIFVKSSLKKRGLKGFVSTKAKTILYPFILWGIVQITIQLILSKYVNSNRTIFSYLDLLYVPRAIDQFWYLYALFNVSVIYATSAVAFKLTPVSNIFIGAVLYYLSTAAHQANISLGFLGDILHYYIFYAIGDLLSNTIRKKENLQYFESWKLLGLLFVPFVASQYYFLRQNLLHPYAAYEYIEYYQPLLFIAIALLGCSFILALSFFLQKLKAIKRLHVLGSLSLYIYVLHVMAVAAVRIFMSKVLGIYSVPILMFFGIGLGLLIPISLYKAACKFNLRWLFTLDTDNKDHPDTMTHVRKQILSS